MPGAFAFASPAQENRFFATKTEKPAIVPYLLIASVIQHTSTGKHCNSSFILSTLEGKT